MQIYTPLHTPQKSTSSRSRPTRLVHETLYKESQLKQEEGRRRRKRIEQKLSSERELRTPGSSCSRSLPEKEGTFHFKTKQSSSHLPPTNARSPARVHESLYNRSKIKQEEGKIRRQKVEEKLSSSKKSVGDSSMNHHIGRKGRMTVDQQSSRNGRYGGGTEPDISKAQMRHTQNHKTKGTFHVDMSKTKKKMSIYQADNLYERLMSHKSKTEERTRDWRRQNEEREAQWMNDISHRKIPLGQATRIYYRGTVTSRSRSRRSRRW